MNHDAIAMGLGVLFGFVAALPVVLLIAAHAARSQADEQREKLREEVQAEMELAIERYSPAVRPAVWRVVPGESRLIDGERRRSAEVTHG